MTGCPFIVDIGQKVETFCVFQCLGLLLLLERPLCFKLILHSAYAIVFCHNDFLLVIGRDIFTNVKLDSLATGFWVLGPQGKVMEND